VHPRWRSRILTAGGLACVAAMFGCFGVGLWFQDCKHTRSGVPNHHRATREGDRYYYAHRGGGPVEQRPHYPLTAEQYRAWEEDERTGKVLMMLAVPFLPAAVLLGAAADRAGKAAEPGAAADRAGGGQYPGDRSLSRPGG
jgi:hypothetical protein